MKPTNIKELNDIALLLVPLCENKIKPVDLSKDAGFIDAYTSDLEFPQNENHIFLLYDKYTVTKESLDRYIRFKSLPTLYSTRHIEHENKYYILYTLVCVQNRKSIKQLLNKKPVNASTLDILYKYWSGVDPIVLHERVYLNTTYGLTNLNLANKL